MSGLSDVATTRPRLQPGTGRPVAWWGVILLAVTEAVLFALLLFTYYYLWAQAETWPPEGVEDPELVKSGIRSVMLLATSGTIWWAERGLRRGDRRVAWTGTVLTVVLAVIFLAGHVEETVKLVEEFRWSDHAYGSVFYTVTNFHAAHLTVGLLMFGFVLVRMGRGAYGPDDDTQFSIAALYWHFVDLVWVAVYSSLYLAPNLF